MHPQKKVGGGGEEEEDQVKGFDHTDFTGGGPYGALLGLATESWEWATVPRCNGMTLLRKKDAPLRADFGIAHATITGYGGHA